MSEMMEQALEVLREKIEGGIDGVAKFDIEDEGAIVIDSEGARLGDDAADVTLSATLDTFRDMLEGDLNPTAAFMSGKLKIDGDMGMAMRLAQIFT
ncbi:SCP2 sterol-binding domain-containing protein [Rhodovulum adriaticum]|uniref:Putative sterol carrier protein n=1 Tax=Rhodovulum adriaticum TaxID=35804 RepID=A0A4R2NJS1_RHOAD|nr:SCP2 sterol-binding domain-containing protein [Rhodovulum adriaticum]MBK1634690.1 sterol carrier family protein [Rhodovulum adriaticum]TCP21602.1 putative sterol carrier protein [Rhodovulum adriaticum]